jgi:hypothetical protein
MTIYEFSNKINAIDLFELLDQVIIENEAEILKIYQEVQLEQGVNEFGGRIGDYTNGVYEFITKPSIRPDWKGILDLKLTGSMYKGQSIGITEAAYIISSDVPYMTELIDRYSNAFLGWNDVTRTQEIQRIILPKLQEKLKHALGLE